MSTHLRKVTVYFTEEEYAPLKAIAEDEEVTVSAVLRAKLGLSYKRRGAPEGNRNRHLREVGSNRERGGDDLLVSDEE
jgi:hypothetical protein